jgi:hypothetical protein
VTVSESGLVGRVFVDDPLVARVGECIAAFSGPLFPRDDGALQTDGSTVLVMPNQGIVFDRKRYVSVVHIRTGATEAEVVEGTMVVFRLLTASRVVRVRATLGLDTTLAVFEPGRAGSRD